MIVDPSVLPAGLPEPEDDGAASHLAGRPMPALAVPSTSGGKLRVDLVPEGTSAVTVTSAAPLDEPAVREAVDEAGYELAGSPA